MEAYKILRNAPSGNYPELKTIEDIKKLYKNPKNDREKIIKEIIRFNLGYRGKPVKDYKHIYDYRISRIPTKTKRINEIKERLKDVIIESGDYKSVIEVTDSKDTLFYLDPPYENTKSLYKHESFDYKELSEILKNIQGKFILSVNDSKNIRTLFEGFNIYSISCFGDFSNKERKELLITNFDSD